MYQRRVVLAEGYAILKDAQVPNWEMSAEQLLMFALGGVSRSKMMTVDEITPSQYADYMAFVERRKNREPLDRIIGSSDFLGVEILYSDSVLTPRCETEILAEIIAKEINNSGQEPKVLDLCCGSGCLGLAIALNCNAKVVLADISIEAVESAKNNYNHNVHMGKVFANQPQFLLSDMFDSIDEKFDIIISNPPYITSQECGELEEEVSQYDPLLALDGGEDGLDYYRTIASKCGDFLVDGGRLYLEFGKGQALAISSMLERENLEVTIIPDYSGIERFIIAKKREKRC